MTGRIQLPTVLRILGRTLLVLLTVFLALSVGAFVLLNAVFQGPSPTARDMLALSLLESEDTRWIPGIFLDDDLLRQIQTNATSELSADITDPASILTGPVSREVRLETHCTSDYTAHILLVGSPDQVTLADADADTLLSSPDTLALINAGSATGGYAGFNDDGILIVAHSMTDSYAEAIGIRDGSGGGPALIINGQVNLSVYNAESGRSRRTAIGQRSDGTVIFLCAEGVGLDSMGATYQDMVDILVEYGAVNACAMDGGSASLMAYGSSMIVSSNSAAQSFWVVRSADEE